MGARIDALTTGLAGVPELLEQVAGRAAANRVRTDLEHAYAAALTRTVLGDTRAPDGVVLPSLECGHVNPACRAAPIEALARPSEDRWWEEQPEYDDVQMLLVGAHTAQEALEEPLVILGQPGAGKSVLTRMLAARLADRGFLPVRVALRSVPADADVQTQVERAIREATGRSIDWPELVDSVAGDGLLPLILPHGGRRPCALPRRWHGPAAGALRRGAREYLARRVERGEHRIACRPGCRAVERRGRALVWGSRRSNR